MRKIKIIISIIMGFMALNLAACFDFIDLSRVTIVSGVLVRVEDDEVHLKLELADTIEGPVGVDIAARMIELSGECVQSALESNIDTSVLRLDFAHTALIAICYETAQSVDISQILSEFTQTGYFCENTLIILSHHDIFTGEEEDVDEFNPHRVISFEIADFIEDTHYSQARVLRRPKVVVQSRLMESRDIYLPVFDNQQKFLKHSNINRGGLNDKN